MAQSLCLLSAAGSKIRELGILFYWEKRDKNEDGKKEKNKQGKTSLSASLEKEKGRKGE